MSLEAKAKQIEYSRRWRTKNPQGSRNASKLWRQKNIERVRLSRRNNDLQKFYGITLDEFNAMLAAQSFTCAICSTALGKGPKDTHVDHCHATGKVRAILCNGCNNVIGRAGDDPAILRAAISYLERHASAD